MNDYRKSLRTVGTVLIIFGVLDIAVMVYCIATGIGYASSFNVFAVIAGIALRRGSLKAVRVVAFFAAFFLSGFVGILIVMPLIIRVPLDFVMIYLKLHPLKAAGGVVYMTSALVLLAWVYRRLMAPEIVTAVAEQETGPVRPWGRPPAGFVVGALLVILMTGLLGLAMRGGSAERAKIEARKRVGRTYKLFVSSVSVSSSTGRKTVVRATVTAYNPHEIRTVELTWEE